MPGSREEDFLRIKVVLHFLSQYYIPFGLDKIGPVVHEKKMLTHDARRRMDDYGRRPIAIGHLSDSGDLKI